MYELLYDKPQFLVIFASIHFAFLVWKIQKLNIRIDLRKKVIREAFLQKYPDQILTDFTLVQGAGKGWIKRKRPFIDLSSYKTIASTGKSRKINGIDPILLEIRTYRIRHKLVTSVILLSVIFLLVMLLSFSFYRTNPLSSDVGLFSMICLLLILSIFEAYIGSKIASSIPLKLDTD